MSSVDLKKEVLEKIFNADEPLLKRIKSAIEDYEENTLVAYSVTGEPLTIAEYRQEILKAEEEIKARNYFTTEELQRQIENWKK